MSEKGPFGPGRTVCVVVLRSAKHRTGISCAECGCDLHAPGILCDIAADMLAYCPDRDCLKAASRLGKCVMAFRLDRVQS